MSSLSSIMLFSSYVPRWLQVLLTEKFFNACIIHEDARKNEKNIYCLDCCISICPHCLAPHSSHRLLQVRRYVYHDVIRLDDATKLMDCGFVQIDYLSRTEDGLSKFLFECNYLPLPDSGLDDGLVTPDSVLEPSCSTKTSSGSGGYDEVWCRALACTATTSEIVRKKRTSLTACRPTCPPVSEVSGNLMNRRKKAPQRAPLY
ncbi:PLATZ transcription factor family protein [Gossypium australe]|uniref:PLATZ transcription factor family protein n=1 Tax=Gossypium australe TaxID=47621 RepID=A0A5B6W2E7_9ROSI|nr:PLATZ transcription factor family protein [Gossypium australe]